MVRQCKHIRQELFALESENIGELNVGTSFFFQCRAFYTLWSRFCGETERPIHITPIVSDFTSSKNPPVDLVETVFFYRESPADMEFLELTRTPLVCALWRDHTLAKKSLLRYEDVSEQTLITIASPSYADILSDLQRTAEQHFAHVRAVPPPEYNISTFSTCAAKGYLLQIPQVWQDIHPQLISIPCEWDYALPYGFFYRKSCPLAAEFIAFVQQLLQSPDFTLRL